MLEHLHRSEALGFLVEVNRSLAPGGVLRVVVPDLAPIVGWYQAHRDEPHGRAEGFEQRSADGWTCCDGLAPLVRAVSGGYVRGRAGPITGLPLTQDPSNGS